ncbi:MAG TPA: bifunctional diaminohydroxyphosphoribosylaminopyrimidine deaminase/5-amino-6-(5-phosphoribosylamino)uracil reductase RibD [Gemmataceae bacterium]|jgi:diaminohydroxyphosphoribosylaminopyrimidine deaminase/5-amino-6-(5-phosphoribosylamino)uracil reductase
MTDADERWMRRALELAERGRGRVEPNPLVGAVVVRDGAAVGEGWHTCYGGPHAEVNALAAAGEAARGATLYVTLEPCCHHGKTPPCTGAVLRAGVGRVVAAMPDPFPQVAGQGIAMLRAAGVEVDVGQCGEEAARLNAPYLTLLRRGRPYVHAKWAMSLDGKIATAGGDSKWISGRLARDVVHQIRGRVDAILVGAGTVRADDPLLTARPPGPRMATRIVLSRTGMLPPDCRLLQTAREVPVLVATLAGRGAESRAAGCEVLELPDEAGRPSVRALLAELGRRRVTNLLVEGGAGVFGSLLDERLIDELHVFVAPTLLGGAAALSPVGGAGAADLSKAWRLPRWEYRTVGDDVYVHGRAE